MFIGFLSKHSQNKSSIKECTPPPNPYRSASIFRHKHLISCVDGWVGVVERAEGGECCSAPCHTFQCEQNKSICEVATGAECTFATGVCCVSPRASVCERVYVCVCVCRSHFGGCLAGWLVSLAFGLSLGSLAGELCYYQSLVTRRHEQKCIRKYSSLQNPFTDLDVSSEQHQIKKDMS